MTVTRLDIADALFDAFAPTGASKDELLACAALGGTHPAVLEEIHRLPNIQYRTMRALWDYLPEVPRA